MQVCRRCWRSLRLPTVSRSRTAASKCKQCPGTAARPCRLRRRFSPAPNSSRLRPHGRAAPSCKCGAPQHHGQAHSHGVPGLAPALARASCVTAVHLVLAPSALLPPTATVPRAVHPPPVAPWWALANLGSGSTAHGTPSGKTATIGSRAAHWPASALRGANGRSPCAGAMRGPVAASHEPSAFCWRSSQSRVRAIMASSTVWTCAMSARAHGSLGPIEWNWPASACGITDRDLGAGLRDEEVRRTQRGEE